MRLSPCRTRGRFTVDEQQSETKNEGDNLFQPSLADILRDWMISTNVPFSTVNRLNVSLQHKLPELPRDARTLMRTLRSCPTGEVPPGSYSFLQPEERTRARILPDCSSLDRRSREAEVGFEPRTFWSET
ncbi:hypothetical protein CSKR_201334 [Clonorchis sinensis]|uniref:Uncharacterized protein n=1 Tax=Clonorchis sinensis TaxID=79923 RepID=A0A8T1MPT2_CLOSI|nr:hypothetical protein CSKR_201334 [Clonorchis sinensis]